MKKYAYIGRSGILHISANKNTAAEYSANGKVVMTEMTAIHGYPVVNGEEIIVYSPEEMKLDARGDVIEVIPELAELYNKCK